MTRPILALSISLVGAVLAAPSGLGETVAFAPADDAVRTFTFDNVVAAEMTEIERSIDGEEQPAPDLDDGPSFATESRLVLTDRFAGAEDGRPTRIERTYEELARTRVLTMGGEEQEEEHESDLAGLTVVFTWDEDEEAFVAVDPEEELDEETLAGLEEDLSLRGFLPSEEVESDDSWSVDIEAYGRLMFPGGELRFHPPDGELDPNRAHISRELSSHLEGNVTVTYGGVEERGDLRLAILALEIEAETRGELVIDGGDGQSRTQTAELERELEGTLFWDLEAGLAHELGLEGDATETVTTETIANIDGELITFSETTTFEGTVSYILSVETE